MIKAAWFRRYAPNERPDEFDRVVQSWDTANKASELSDFSVCASWGIKGKDLYLLHVLRKRMEYPELKRAAEDRQPERACDDRAGPVEGNADMASLTRRSVLRTSLALGAVGARPHVAKAAATTATVWWTQGYAQEEDISFKKVVAEYEKATGNTLDYSIVPYAPLRQKIVSAVTSGVVPDVFPNQPAEIIALFAWNDQLVDLSDVVETQREEYTDTALLTAGAVIELAESTLTGSSA